MKFKVKVIISEEREWDTEWYPDAETPEEAIAAQLAYWENGDGCPVEFFGEYNPIETKVEKL